MTGFGFCVGAGTGMSGEDIATVGFAEGGRTGGDGKGSGDGLGGFDGFGRGLVEKSSSCLGHSLVFFPLTNTILATTIIATIKKVKNFRS